MSDTVRDALGTTLLGVLLFVVSSTFMVVRQNYLLDVQECVGDDLSDAAWAHCVREVSDD